METDGLTICFFSVEWYALEAWRVVDVEGGDDFIV
jgi:hypothetical protein